MIASLYVLTLSQQHLLFCSKSDLFPFPLRAGTKYSVAVFGMFEGGQSTALAGEERTTLSDAPDLPFPDSSGKTRTFTQAERRRFCRSHSNTLTSLRSERLPPEAAAAVAALHRRQLQLS